MLTSPLVGPPGEQGRRGRRQHTPRTSTPPRRSHSLPRPPAWSQWGPIKCQMKKKRVRSTSECRARAFTAIEDFEPNIIFWQKSRIVTNIYIYSRIWVVFSHGARASQNIEKAPQAKTLNRNTLKHVSCILYTRIWYVWWSDHGKATNFGLKWPLALPRSLNFLQLCNGGNDKKRKQKKKQNKKQKNKKHFARQRVSMEQSKAKKGKKKKNTHTHTSCATTCLER